MKKIILFSLLLLISHVHFGQINSAQIIGTVKDSTGLPVMFATVAIQNTTKGAATDAKGNFVISNLKEGTYTLLISAVGYVSLKENISLSEGERKEVNLNVQPSNALLNEVVVTSRKKEQKKENLTSSITIVNAQTLQEQQMISSNPTDILAATVPGLGHSNGTTSNWGQTLRGRQLLILIDGVPQSTPLRNGAMDIRTIDPNVLERIEVLKGATSIYGNGAAGGAINYITRRNTDTKQLSSRTEIASMGSIVNSQGSLGSRLNQTFYGKTGNFDYTVSGGFEQTGEMKDAQGDIIGPTYGMSNNQIVNGFGKLGFDITPKQRIQLSYNYFSSQAKTDLKEVLGSYKTETKTQGEPGVVGGAPQGTRWNHNALLKYSNNFYGKNSLNVSAYAQDVSTVFFWSPTFEFGGQSTIRSSKKGLRLDLNSGFEFDNWLEGDLTYGFDLLSDNTSQPLLDGRTWVPEMNMVSWAPFAQLQTTLFKNLVFNGGVRYERMNIGVNDYMTLKPYNYKTKTFGESINVKGGELNYGNLVFNTGLKYNAIQYFKPFVNFSQGFSVADLGLALRAAKVNDLSQIQTSAVIVNNYEAGFASENDKFRLEASAYISHSELGSSYKEINGVYSIVRTPEMVWGYEVAADVILHKSLTGGATFTWLEGKRDENDNKKFSDEKDTWIGGDRISAPKYTAYLKYSPLRNLHFRADWIASGGRNRFEKSSETGIYKTYEGIVKPYQIVNLSASFKISKEATIRAGIENLLNEDFYPARAQWSMLDSYYIKGRGTNFTVGVVLDL